MREYKPERDMTDSEILQEDSDAFKFAGGIVCAIGGVELLMGNYTEGVTALGVGGFALGLAKFLKSQSRKEVHNSGTPGPL